MGESGLKIKFSINIAQENVNYSLFCKNLTVQLSFSKIEYSLNFACFKNNDM